MRKEFIRSSKDALERNHVTVERATNEGLGDPEAKQQDEANGFKP